MASKLTTVILFAALFAVINRQANAASLFEIDELSENKGVIDFSGLSGRPWIPFTICLKGADICQNLVATTADDFDQSLLADIEPIILNIDEEDSDDEPLSDTDIGEIPVDRLAALIDDIPLNEEELKSFLEASSNE